jgi:hypothetical protein
VVKRGKFFSILAVLTLLILLAPAVISAPVGNVAANGGAVTEEIEASFSFSVDSGGQWLGFTAGSGGFQEGDSGVRRLALVQYTRQNVVIPNSTPQPNVPGCGFRNYTTGSGSVASTVGNLTGTMTLEWIAFRFNMTYNHTPIYMTAANFGWMSGRGHYYDAGNSANNFTFVFVADLDCNSDMTVAAGKGFIYSVEENGRFGDMADTPDLRHKLIGGFDIALSGGTYSGNFHLRNYPPDEVYDDGMMNVTGGVMQEFTDDINPQLELLNVTSDGSMFTPYDTEQQPGFEEIDWGKDPTKTITYSVRLGANGTMGITRNSALYLNQSVEGGHTYITIQANPVCVLSINDTYAVTGDDGSPYGELWELLLLALPLQKLELGGYFNQTGYTFCPFGTVNGRPGSGTGCYAGTESFADATIEIEASVGNSLQRSTDYTYGLFAHPKVASVVPASGSPGQTINVTIKGKYFLRAAGQKSGWVPNSGSVSFGNNITVNSYTIKNSSPIDNEITANITIAGDAAGARDVNVTSCFGYSSGSGSTPYETGTLPAGFSVVAAGSSLEGHVTFAGRGTAPNDKWIETFVVKGFTPGTSNLLWTNNATTNNTGVFTVTGLTPGTYDVSIKNWTCLSEKVAGVTLNSTAVVDFGTPREGDSSNDDYITGADRSILYTGWGSQSPAPGYNWKADFNRDGWLTGSDRSYMYTNWGQKGDLIP